MQLTPFTGKPKSAAQLLRLFFAGKEERIGRHDLSDADNPKYTVLLTAKQAGWMKSFCDSIPGSQVSRWYEGNAGIRLAIAKNGGGCIEFYGCMIPSINNA